MTASARERDIVAAAVESLHPEHRQILVEAYFKGRSATEAAHALDLPVRVVKVRIYDALRELRRNLAAAGVPVHQLTGRKPVAA